MLPRYLHISVYISGSKPFWIMDFWESEERYRSCSLIKWTKSYEIFWELKEPTETTLGNYRGAWTPSWGSLLYPLFLVNFNHTYGIRHIRNSGVCVLSTDSALYIWLPSTYFHCMSQSHLPLVCSMGNTLIPQISLFPSSPPPLSPTSSVLVNGSTILWAWLSRILGVSLHFCPSLYTLNQTSFPVPRSCHIHYLFLIPNDTPAL